MQEQVDPSLARDVRDALAVIVRAFHVIGPQIEDPGAHGQIMIMSIDLIAVISRIEDRLPSSSGESHSAQDDPLARDVLTALGVIGKALVAISENTKDPDGKSEIRDKAIDLVPIAGSIEARLKA